ncbi:hypothetical protein D3C80_789580 [compost metagenome]
MRQIGGAVCILVVCGELSTGEDHRLGERVLQIDEQRGFFHRVGSVQNNDARHRGVIEFHAYRIADALHVGQGQAGRILGHQIDRLQPRADLRNQRQQILTGKAGCAGAIGAAPAGDGATGGDDRHQWSIPLPAQCDAPAPARSAARR